MTLRHLEILKAVYEAGNFTRAAENLFITQSAVSHGIRELEEQAGTVLFERMSKRVRITESGRMLLEEALPLLSSFNALTARMGHLEQLAPIRIASSITIAAFRLPEVMSRFERMWPEVPVEVRVQSAAGSLNILKAGETDLALVEGTPPAGPFAYTCFSSYQLTMVCSPDFKARHQPQTIRDICALPLLLREKGSAIRDTFDSALYLKGYTPRPRWTSVNSTVLLEAAKSGLGITVLPDMLVQDAICQRTLCKLTIDELDMINQMIAVHDIKKPMTASFRELLNLITDPVRT